MLEWADRTLRSAIDHERFAGLRWHVVRAVAHDLGEALHRLHARGIIHADFKPMNAVRTGGQWRLIDLDASCVIGEAFGDNKLPSTGYCPPEMARLLLNEDHQAAADAHCRDGNGVRGEQECQQPLLKGYQASVAHDLWSFGAVLFQLVTGETLWHMNQDDSVKARMALMMCLESLPSPSVLSPVMDQRAMVFDV